MLKGDNMKNFIRLVNATIVVGIALSLCGCGSTTNSSSKKQTQESSNTSSPNSIGSTVFTENSASTSSTNPITEEPTVVNTYGNSGGNVADNGYVAQQGDWIFYSNCSDNWYIYKVKTDGTGKEKLNSIADSTGINVIGKW